MLLVARLEREYLADRSGFVTAALMSGSEATPLSFDEVRAGFDADLVAEPEPMSERDRDNQAFLRALSA